MHFKSILHSLTELIQRFCENNIPNMKRSSFIPQHSNTTVHEDPSVHKTLLKSARLQNHQSHPNESSTMQNS